MKWIKHFFGWHDWRYVWLEKPVPYARNCTICHMTEYSTDFMDILNNKMIK